MNIIFLIRQFLPFIKYCFVGVIGTGIDLFTVIILVEFFAFHPVISSFFGFLLAVINNFLLNKRWTFQNKSANYRKLWIKFFLVSSIGLFMTLFLMFVFYEKLHIDYRIAKLLTSAIVLIWNFLANKLWTFRSEEHFPHIPEHFQYDLSVIIPAYNEENRIKNTLIIINNYRKENELNAEIIVVSDGSLDATNRIVCGLQKEIPHLSLLTHQKNRGKGYSVKCGVEKSKGKYILMADADNSTPIEEYQALRKKIQGKDIAIGSRYTKGSKVKRKQSTLRIAIGRIGNTIIRIFLIDDIADTQCGFKLFRHHAAKEIFFRQKVTRFGFDVEALVIAQSLGYKIVEVPVSWFHSVESRFRPFQDALKTLLDLVYIKLNLWSGRYR